MAASAASRSLNIISTTTKGRGVVTWQESMGPQTGSMAARISAAVVPSAKFRPTTTNGPESGFEIPLMEMVSLFRMIACPFAGSRALARRCSSANCLFADFDFRLFVEELCPSSQASANPYSWRIFFFFFQTLFLTLAVVILLARSLWTAAGPVGAFPGRRFLPRI